MMNEKRYRGVRFGLKNDLSTSRVYYYFVLLIVSVRLFIWMGSGLLCRCVLAKKWPD